jgi:hypothetical protein
VKLAPPVTLARAVMIGALLIVASSCTPSGSVSDGTSGSAASERRALSRSGATGSPSDLTLAFAGDVMLGRAMNEALSERSARYAWSARQSES